MAKHLFTFNIEGMHCSACVSKIERELLKTFPQVESVSVNLVTQRALLQGKNGKVAPEHIIQCLSKLGYTATLLAENQFVQWARQGIPLWELGVAFLFTAGVLYFNYLSPLEWQQNARAQAILVTLFLLTAGRRFYWNTLRQALKLTITMDTLVTLGSLIAYMYSIAIMMEWGPLESHVFFDTTVLIISIVLVGRYLEGKSFQKANAALETVLHAQPLSALKFVENTPGEPGQFQSVPLNALNMGDRISIRTGDRVPADCIITEGSSAVNESMITGESTWIRRNPGDTLYAGTLNQEQALVAEVLRPPTDSFLAHVLQLIDTAQNSKPPLQELADRVAGWALPSILLIGLLTGLAWYFAGLDWTESIHRAISVILIACPCAIGLATPVAIQIAIAQAATQGMIIRNAKAFESASKLNLLALDKTGTLTEGHPSVQAWQWMTTPCCPFTEAQALALVFTLEQQVTHPLAEALSRYVSKHISQDPSTLLSTIALEQSTVVPGAGVSIKHQTPEGLKPIYLGNPKFLQSHGVTLPEITSPESTLKGTIVCLSYDGELIGYFLVSDQLRESAPALLDQLRKYNIEPILLSGDREANTRAVAEQLGIRTYQAQLSPQEKLQNLAHYQIEMHKTVGMFGDGINDGPALAQADISFSIGQASDLAKQLADVVFLSDDLRHLNTFLALAKQTMRIVRQNLVWAFIYNLVCIPLAIFGILHPMWACVAMSFSSLSVVANALRLNTKALRPSRHF